MQEEEVKVVHDKRKKAEIHLAVHVACHSAIRAVDHSTDVIVEKTKNVREKGEEKGGDPPVPETHLANIKLKRTKCIALITKVVAPALLRTLVKDVGDVPYSLIVDESTDVSVEKYLAVCIRYFS